MHTPFNPLFWDNDRAQRNLVMIKENKCGWEEKLRVLPKIAELFWKLVQMLFQWTRRHRGSWDQWTRFMWPTSWMKRTITNGDEYHFEKGNKISVKKIHKMLLLAFLGLLMAYLKRHRLRSYFKTNNCFIIIWVKTGNNHAFFAKTK